MTPEFHRLNMLRIGLQIAWLESSMFCNSGMQTMKKVSIKMENSNRHPADYWQKK